MKIKIDERIDNLELDINCLQAFKNRWFEILVGYSEIDPNEDNLKTCALLNTELFLIDILEQLKVAESEEKTKKPKNNSTGIELSAFHTIGISADNLQTDIENLQAFKNRWFEILVGYSEIDTEGDNLKTCALLSAEQLLLDILKMAKEAENE